MAGSLRFPEAGSRHLTRSSVSAQYQEIDPGARNGRVTKAEKSSVETF
jgi:hypothetical protein